MFSYFDKFADDLSWGLTTLPTIWMVKVKYQESH